MQLIQLDWLYRVLGDVDLDDPIILYELKRLPTRQIGNWTRVLDVLGGMEFIFTLPGFWVPFIHWLWRVPGLLASAGIVSHEIEGHTWNVVRSTTLTVEQIMMAKYAALLRYMEPHYMLIIYIRAMPAIIFGVSWGTSTLTVLPQQGFAYWFSTSLAFLFAGVYLLISPVLDAGFDAALGMLASTLSGRRSTSLIMTMFIRLAGWMLPFALTIPIQFGISSGLPTETMIQLRAIATVGMFGPAYAFLWGINTWLSVIIVLVYVLVRFGLIRWMLATAINRAANLEV
jgi:hypothetical protein